MRVSPSNLLLVTATVPFAVAQSLADLPACAQQAGLGTIQASGCAITDVACVCSMVSVLDSLRATILQACSYEDQTSALVFANTLCGAAGQPSIAPSGPSVTAQMPEMPSSTAEMGHTPASMVSSAGSASVMYTTYSGTSTSTTSMTNTSMHPSSTSASRNMSMSITTSMAMSSSMTMTASPSQFTGGAFSRASTLEREWILPALGFAGIIVATF